MVREVENVDQLYHSTASGKPQAFLPEHCVAMQKLAAATAKSHCSEKAQASALASL